MNRFLRARKERVFQRKENRKKTVGNQMTVNKTGLKIRRIYQICVANPLKKELPRCLIYPPSLTVPEACINIENVATTLFGRDAPFVANLLQKIYSFIN